MTALSIVVLGNLIHQNVYVYGEITVHDYFSRENCHLQFAFLSYGLQNQCLKNWDKLRSQTSSILILVVWTDFIMNLINVQNLMY